MDEEDNEGKKFLAEIKNMDQQDKQFLAEVDSEIDQAKRNSAQGDLGRALALSKIADAKAKFSQLKDNFQKESKGLVSDGKHDAKSEEDEDQSTDPTFKLDQKKQNIHKLEQKLVEVNNRVPIVQQLEWDMGLPSDQKDLDLIELTKSFQTNLDEAKKAVRSQEVSEAEAVEASKPKEKF